MAFDIGGATFGYDIQGTMGFINELKASYLDKAATDARKTGDIDDAIDGSWVGQAADDFKTALHKDANALAKTLEELCEQLQNQVLNIASSIADMDNGLMSNLRK